jgi:integrase
VHPLCLPVSLRQGITDRLLRQSGRPHLAALPPLDGGAPVSVYTVSRELGHTSPAMVQRVYAHLGTIRHRAEVVEYRVEQHTETPGERLTALQRLVL